MDVILPWEEIVHVVSRKEGLEGGIAGSVVCEETSVVCGMALMGAGLDPARVLLACWGPSGCDTALAPR